MLPVSSGFLLYTHAFRSLLRIFMYYSRCNTLTVRTRNCRLLQSHFRDVAITVARITDITLSRMTLAPAAIFCPGIGTRSGTKEVKKVESVKTFGSIHTLRSLRDQGEGGMCAMFGSNWFRNVNLYKVQTNKHRETNKQTNFQQYIL